MSAQQWTYDLFAAIAHGDEAHRKWLLDAIIAWSEGCPVPPPSGSGDLEQLRAERDAAVERADAAERKLKMLEFANECADISNANHIDGVAEQARTAALREALDVCEGVGLLDGANWATADRCHRAILALIAGGDSNE